MSEHHCDRCDVAMKVTDKGWHPVGGRLVVATRCDEDCPDHYEFIVDPVEYDEDSDISSGGRLLNLDEMREIAWLVEQADSGV